MFRSNPPDPSARVVCDKQRPVRPLRYSDWSAINFRSLFVGNEAGEDVFERTNRLAVLKTHKGYLIAHHLRTVPRTVHAYECAAAIMLWKRTASIESETQRCDVGAQSIIGFDCLCHEIGPLAFLARIFILTKVSVGPAIEGS